jgi:hypothetical protein
LAACLDTVCLSLVIEENFVNVLVQHEGTTVDGADTRKSLWKATKSIQGINVRGSSVTGKRVAVDLQLLEGRKRWLIHVIFIELEAHGMGNELMSIWLQTKGLVKLSINVSG